MASVWALAGRGAGGRPLRRGPGPRLFRGIHVPPGPQRLQGLPGAAGGADAGVGLHPPGLPAGHRPHAAARRARDTPRRVPGAPGCGGAGREGAGELETFIEMLRFAPIDIYLLV